MGRAGITLSDVEKAILQLQGRGKNPTVDAVREILGTGSKSTIAQHLRTLKASVISHSNNLPEELFALVTGLWERLNLKAEERIEAVEKTSREELQAVKINYENSLREHESLKQKFHLTEENLNKVSYDNTMLHKEVEQGKNAYQILLERFEATAKHLEDVNAEKTRLHQLASHMQANLEHYQNAIQQLRAEQAVIMEKQHAQFQHELLDLRKQLSISVSQLHHAETAIHEKTLLASQWELNCHKTEEHNNQFKKELSECVKQISTLQERVQQYQIQIQSQEQANMAYRDRLSVIEKEAAIMQDQNRRLTSQISDFEDKIEKLRHDNLFLIQEKAQLEGSIKQFKMKSVLDA